MVFPQPWYFHIHVYLLQEKDEDGKFKVRNRKKVEERDLKKMAPQQRSRYLAVCNIWALSRENLSLGYLSKRFSNQPTQLQRLAIELTFHL